MAQRSRAGVEEVGQRPGKTDWPGGGGGDKPPLTKTPSAVDDGQHSISKPSVNMNIDGIQ